MQPGKVVVGRLRAALIRGESSSYVGRPCLGVLGWHRSHRSHRSTCVYVAYICTLHVWTH